ncbi:uncharacterized protein LY79DRAFT_10214 [Colletotrichum navitas]|uniref:Uncharacterized protein n=1 Tax=Colletotrichum navitas TaxID=681940 RepID=A0AAD8QCR2_9PEZI|nr:uncharacterized protein LY79DRAFT_10214 [Colletotrichum navitas]KAK1600188.1 hypothetical protein LY79DRAFT_10214 [Colletotrichum navitas]
MPDMLARQVALLAFAPRRSCHFVVICLGDGRPVLGQVNVVPVRCPKKCPPTTSGAYSPIHTINNNRSAPLDGGGLLMVFTLVKNLPGGARHVLAATVPSRLRHSPHDGFAMFLGPLRTWRLATKYLLPRRPWLRCNIGRRARYARRAPPRSHVASGPPNPPPPARVQVVEVFPI